MSLTGQLARSDSPLSLFFKENFTQTPSYLLGDITAVSQCTSILPRNLYQYKWSEVGHIVEYLICLSVGIDVSKLMPMVYLKSTPRVAYQETYQKICQAFVKPIQSDSAIFMDQCRHLLMLAELEGVIRHEAKVRLNYDVNLSEVIFNDLKEIFDTSIKGNELLKGKYIYNPTFELSALVGGADADIIRLGQNDRNNLIDIKTTKNPTILVDWLYQLLGYAFLDKNNKYKIEEISIFLPRQNGMLTWDVETFIQNGSNFKSFRQGKKEFLKAVELTSQTLSKKMASL